MEELKLFGGVVNGPAFLAAEVIAACATYRDVVRVSWAHRRIKNMHRCVLAELIGRHPQHVSDYLAADDQSHRRSLPAECLNAWAAAVGNFGVQQWLARQSQLTLMEEVISQRAA